MIEIHRRKETSNEDYEWIRIYALFSFANYYDADNICFGILPTFNEYTVASGCGFPMHPHQDMELLYVLLDGEMEHKDSMGNECMLKAGDVQRISAGSGIARSAYNTGGKNLHYLTIWLLPRVLNLAPSHEVRHFSKESYLNKLCVIASDRTTGQISTSSPVAINAAATVFRGYYDSTAEIEFIPTGSHQLVFVLSGLVTLKENILEKGDHARIQLDKINMNIKEHTEVFIVDMRC